MPGDPNKRDPRIYPPDIEAAERAIEDNPTHKEAFGGHVDALARVHARDGDQEFQLMLGLRPPRHAFEWLKIKLWLGLIDEPAYRRLAPKIALAPITEPLIDFLLKDFEVLLTHYSQLQSIVVQVHHDKRGEFYASEWEPVIAYHAREMTRPTSLLKEHMIAYGNLALECRVEANRPILQPEAFSAPTACLFLLRVFAAAAEQWFHCEKLAQQSFEYWGPGLATNATKLFYQSMFAELPKPRLLQSHLYDEATLVKLKLRKQTITPAVAPAGPNPEAAQMPPSHPVNERQSGPEPRQSAKTGSTSPTSPSRANQPNLKKWAIGYDGQGNWLLFHETSGFWDTPAKIEIDGRLPKRLLEMLAAGAGILGGDEAVAKLKTASPLKNYKQLFESAKVALSRGRTAVRRAIASAGKFDFDSVADPLPWQDEQRCWRAEIDIGYAILEGQRYVFKRLEDLQAGG